MPGAVWRAKYLWIMLSLRRTVGFEQSPLFQPQRVENFVVPKDIAPRAARFADDRLRQADGFGAFEVVFTERFDLRLGSEFVQHGFGELAVERGLDDDLGLGIATA